LAQGEQQVLPVEMGVLAAILYFQQIHLLAVELELEGQLEALEVTAVLVVAL
jgi:hypothetical protein